MDPIVNTTLLPRSNDLIRVAVALADMIDEPGNKRELIEAARYIETYERDNPERRASFRRLIGLLARAMRAEAKS